MQPSRIIPADAGSTSAGLHTCDLPRDHPRGCGEHMPRSCRACRYSGSSPRMRGALAPSPVISPWSRIIPADAGSTRRCFEQGGPCVDHPRGCGEHIKSFDSTPIYYGSSPRMRGALYTIALKNGDWEDHPRGCGEHHCSSTQEIMQRGSSPRMRGAPARSARTCQEARDHPRGCGEHSWWATTSSSTRGSSPRMRGAHQRLSGPTIRQRIIPADAGSTDAYAKAHWERQDHPRGCGEHGHPDVG